jgi:hypothetical protein
LSAAIRALFAPLEQKHPQLLALATAARHAQALAGDDPPRHQGRVDEIILATTRPLTAPRPLALKHRLAVIGQEAGKTRSVAPASLDPKGRLTQGVRPHHQLLIARLRRRDGQRVD